MTIISGGPGSSVPPSETTTGGAVPPVAELSRGAVVSTEASTSGPAKRRVRKEEIIAEATRLFAERGYEGASMGDLAERVGLRKASLFHHFPSKDSLYATVLVQLLEGVRNALVAATTSEGSFEERLDALTDAVTTTLAARPHAARLLVREAMDWGPMMREGLGPTVNEVLTSARQVVERGQREGAVDPTIDGAQVIVSLIGLHLLPFAVAEVTERFTGAAPFHPAAIEERKAAVRSHVRRLLLARGK